MAKYKQGKFIPRNPEKYIGNFNDIIYRSSWEFKVMHWFDSNSQVLNWSSETVIIPYISPIDNRAHRYFVDFKVKIKNNQGQVTTYLVEVKPEAQTVPPAAPKKITEKSKMRYINESKTYGVNAAKWEAATKFAKDRGFQFIILTERQLGL